MRKIGIFSFANEITYMNLKAGDYELQVESYFNSRGANLEPFSYSFKINPPWWESQVYFIQLKYYFYSVIIIFYYFYKTKYFGKIATSLTFLVILIIFEYFNMIIEDIII